ncbi:hypothetical protein [Cellulomonas xiejunii]|uniref:DUF4304 domain-containing protein n=1 Tax=Cellulomonas xiejunii TaxID=2968083 RepID=A0ABY5KPC5_9CELL|nr:hypothetical protein [Cellulomonas xiejunii]MCC2322277.1 hypothetical protein [Cellulomonas xiejunii]UUI72331.1 hypothetical protein NP048_02350 [Cellulomonas xiejunii]
MERDEILSVLRGGLRERGFTGPGGRLRLVSPHMAWMVDLGRVPRTDRAEVYVGICPVELAPGGWPTCANNCPIVLYPESGGAPFGLDRWDAWQALDAGSSLSDEIRRGELLAIVDAVAELSTQVTTLQDLKEMFAAGRLRQFVHKNARALLRSP